MANVFIGVDLGTSGCRATAIDSCGKVLADSIIDLPAPLRRDNGASEQDADLWWQSVLHTLRAVAEETRGHSLRAIAIDGTSATLLATDAAGVPAGPALMYDDSRGGRYLSLIRERAPTGSATLSASSSLAKALFLFRRTPAARISHLLHQSDWILGRLSGRYGVSDENNALKLGYDVLQRRWPDWVFELGLPATWFPQVQPAGTHVGLLSAGIARTLGVGPDVSIITGTTDSTAAVLATGVHEPGEAVTSLGSTLVLKVLSTEPVSAPRFGVYSHRLGELWLVGGASNSGGAILDHFFSRSEMVRLSRSLDPGYATGLDYYPLLRPGERFPFNDPGYPPRIEPRPEEPARFFQALLEGIADIEREGYQRLHSLGVPRPGRVVSIGGGAGNEPWRQIREQLLGITVVTARQQQAAYGSALLAMQASG